MRISIFFTKKPNKPNKPNKSRIGASKYVRLNAGWYFFLFFLFFIEAIFGRGLSYKELTKHLFEKAKVYYQADLMTMQKAIPPKFITLVIPGIEVENKHPIVKGVLITYRSFKAKSVSVGGSFNNWKKVRMVQNSRGIWFTVLELDPNQNFMTYRLCVDSLWIPNPLGESQFMIDAGGEVSVFHYSFKLVNKQSRTVVKDNGRVLFQIYLPHADRVSVAGDFNRWNLWHDFLKKDENGDWKLEMVLKPGIYLYRFYVDDRWRVDLYNSLSKRDKTGILSSVLIIPD